MKAFQKAAKVVDEEPQNPSDENEDSDEVEKHLKKEFNVEWKLIPPGSQWRDPAERAIKSVKNMMKSVFNTDKEIPVLTIGEYWCLFSEISEILNRRPTEGIMYDGTLRFICPNDLLLGRTSKDQPIIMSDALNVKTRIKLIEEIKQTFWKNYLNALAGNSHLFMYPCWYAQSRNPM